jgi:hypothetical protein
MVLINGRFLTFLAVISLQKCYLSLCLLNWKYVHYDQGDQIGRIFASWAIIVFLTLFLENYRSSLKTLCIY